jgi:hypothetical protein
LLLQIYVEVDDLLQAYQSFCAHKKPEPVVHPTREPQLSPSEIVTIVVAYHASGYKCFEYYYRECILKTCRTCFPKAPSYQRFDSYLGRVLPLVLLVLMCKCAQSLRTGYYFIDSKKLVVCHLKREHAHKVFKGFARKGKSSTGWFYGLKLHLVINHLGQIVSFLLTPGSTADNNFGVLTALLQGLKGKCCGDKGYLSTLFEQFYCQGLHLLVKSKENMKALPAFASDVELLDHRSVIESVNDILITVCNIEHSRHRNAFHGLTSILAALTCYQYLPHKPHIFIPGSLNYLQAAA